MGITLPLTILLSLLGTGASLSCFHCNGTVDSCTQTSELCQARASLCISEVQTRTGTDHPVFLKKGCSSEDVCNGTSQASFVNGNLSSKVICCHSELCNTHFMDPPAPWHENGHRCVTCYDSRLGQCNPDTTDITYTKCYGNMNYCLDKAVRTGSSSIVVKGCASGDMCQGDLTIFSPTRNVIVYCCTGFLCNEQSVPRRTAICEKFQHKEEAHEMATGLECHSCCETGKGECLSQNATKATAKCTGQKDRCISITDDTGERTILRGCIEERKCESANRIFGLGAGTRATCCSDSLCNWRSYGITNHAQYPTLVIMLLVATLVTSASE